MAVYLTGVTFPTQRVTPSDDGAVNNSALTDGILHGCAIASSSTNITVQAGRIVAYGREVKVDSVQSVPTTSGNNYVRLKLVIDLSKAIAQQCELVVDYASSPTGFASLTRNNINAGGTKYEMPLAIFAMSGATVGAKYWSVREAHANGLKKSYTLPAASWGNDAGLGAKFLKLQDVNSYPGTTAICSYAPDSHDEWVECGVFLHSITLGYLYFKCDVIPTTDLTANVIWL